MDEATSRFEQIEIPLPEPVHEQNAVTGVLGVPEWWPTGSRVSVVLAHGREAEDPLLESLQQALTERKILTLRFRFPFVEAKKSRPDPMPVLQRTFRAALGVLGRDPTAAPAHLFVGGKNLGAQVAAQAAAARLRVDGVYLLGYPLHKQGNTAELRDDPLYRVISPVLFVQGTRDRHCDLDALRRVLLRVGAVSKLHVVEEADHTFKVAKKSGRVAEDVHAEVLTTLHEWILKVLGE